MNCIAVGKPMATEGIAVGKPMATEERFCLRLIGREAAKGKVSSVLEFSSQFTETRKKALPNFPQLYADKNAYLRR